jgi:hypothetical protein
MPRPREEFETVRPLEFRTPEEVLDDDQFYTVAEIGRLLQGLSPGEPLDPETENVLLDWAIPWMLNNAESFVFAEPEDEDSAGYYGLATRVEA